MGFKRNKVMGALTKPEKFLGTAWEKPVSKVWLSLLGTHATDQKPAVVSCPQHFDKHFSDSLVKARVKN